ncbi:high-potential iron-sulfur protein [Variovorax boronicumulans]|uniref:high-potential iron-sulfur protein n=1 Tax=Variovorax boronicumulans TaxID=436515 RepID=UPI00339941A3
MNTSRRTFMITLVAAGASASATNSLAQATLDEKNPQAMALGYAVDSSKVDAKKYPKHDKAQLCNGCALWQSKPTDAQGNCPLFAGKQVSAKGWCSAWARKA